MLALRHQHLVAVYADAATTRRLQGWLNKPPQPEWRRIPPQVLETALLQGEVKGLWLQGTHRRRTTKPDSKNISGTRLQDALDPAHDSSFAMRSARVDLESSPDRTAFAGKVGTTPANSSVWSSAPTIDFAHYVTAVIELLTLVRAAMHRGPTTAGPLPVLARQASDLSGITGAYAVAVLTPDDLLSFPNTDTELVSDAELLQHAIHAIDGDPHSAAFTLDVGIDGAIGGRLGVTPKHVNGRYILDIGLRGNPTDPARVQPVRDALVHGDLLTIYYRSGHAYAHNTFYTAPITTARFANWDFRDFTGYRLDQEKPKAAGTQAIHDAIGVHGDESLFAWVVRQYRDGWLICDDGSGEVADFVHIANDGTLTLIHVKAAHSASPRREIAVVPYEVVVSQAVKNVIYADSELLTTNLTSPGIARPACWIDGVRVEDRTEFLKVLQIRDSTDRTEVVVVQPHVNSATYARVRGSSCATTGPTNELLRLYLLERLLTSARSNIVAACDDLTVIGSCH
ncbi:MULTISPECIES: hypothetical protein [unclassified Nocardia]|uniref:hypothetical protein n=1 Tax=unclassified Nocardia TaxID=2637762 RepID=UPI00278BFBBE|nr:MULTISPECIES: hypothetical protein [unclassified Nocardia]